VNEVIKRAINVFGGAESDWRMIGEAAVHVSVNPSDECAFAGPAIIYGGNFRGGYFFGGDFHGGEFRGGEFRGGEFHGGRFFGREFHGGRFFGGEFQSTPIQLQGLLLWNVTVQGTGDDRISIGCQCHSFDDWMKDGEQIAADHGADWAKVKKVLEFVESIRKGE